MNIWDALLIALIAAAAGLALRRVIRTRKTGGCACGCENCGAACPSAKKRR